MRLPHPVVVLMHVHVGKVDEMQVRAWDWISNQRGREGGVLASLIIRCVRHGGDACASCSHGTRAGEELNVCREVWVISHAYTNGW